MKKNFLTSVIAMALTVNICASTIFATEISMWKNVKSGIDEVGQNIAINVSNEAVNLKNLNEKDIFLDKEIQVVKENITDNKDKKENDKVKREGIYDFSKKSIEELYKDAYYATTKCLNLRTQESIKEAREVIARIPRNFQWAIGEFSKQVDSIQQPIFEKIIETLEKAKELKSQLSINESRKLIKNIIEDQYKATWSAELDKVQQEKISNLVKSIQRASIKNDSESWKIANEEMKDIDTVEYNDGVKQWIYTYRKQIDVEIVGVKELTNKYSEVVCNELTKEEIKDILKCSNKDELIKYLKDINADKNKAFNAGRYWASKKVDTSSWKIETKLNIESKRKNNEIKKREAKLKEEQGAKERETKLKEEQEAKAREAKLKEEQEAKERETKLKEEQEAKAREAKLKEEQEAKERETKLKEEQEAKERETKLKEEQEAKERETKLKEEQEAKVREAKLKEEQGAKERETKLKEEQEAKVREAKLKEEQEAKAREAREARLKEEQEAKAREAKLKEEQEAKAREARLKEEQEAKAREAKLKEEQEAKERETKLKEEQEAKVREAKLKEEKVLNKLIEDAKNNVNLGDLDNVKSNLILPNKSHNGVEILWKSMDISIIKNDGTVIRPNLEEGDRQVNLIATFSKNFIKSTKIFKITVKAKEELQSQKEKNKILELLKEDKKIEVNNQEQFDDVMKEAIMQLKTNYTVLVPIKEYSNYKFDNFSNIMTEIGGKDFGKPHISTMGGRVSVINERVPITIQLDYRKNLDEVKKQKQAIEEAVRKIIREVIKEDMTPVQKELALHDYLVKHADYNMEGLKKNPADLEDHNAYGVLVLGKGVCESYAKAMQLLLEEVGIECKYVTGKSKHNGQEGGGHAWNMVKLDNEWYNLDATWDDPVSDRNGTNIVVEGSTITPVIHTYFNVTDDILNQDHIRGDYEERNYPRCTSTKYAYDNMDIDEYTNDGKVIPKVTNKEELDKLILEALKTKKSSLYLRIKGLNMTQKQLSEEVKVVANGKFGLGWETLSSDKNHVLYKFNWV